MKILTINDLFKECQEQIKIGNGDKVLVMSSDDECNEYHHAWTGLFDGNLVKGDIEPYQLTHCTSKNIGDFVVLI